MVYKKHSFAAGLAKSAMKSGLRLWKKVANNIVSGLKNGLNSGKSSMSATAKAVAEAALGIKSPSKECLQNFEHVKAHSGVPFNDETFEILTGALREVGETLNKLFACFSEDEKEEKHLFLHPDNMGIFLKNNHQICSRSLYKPPFLQVPKHLAYQRRHYQSLFRPLLYLRKVGKPGFDVEDGTELL